MLYNTTELIDRLNSQGIFSLITVTTVLGFIGGFILFFEATRITLREGIIGFPLGYFCVAFAHDGLYVVNYAMGDVADHWYFRALAFGVIPFVLWEIVIIFWFLPKARAEFAPHISRTVYYGTYALYQALTIALFLTLFTLIDDPLDIISIIPAHLAAVVFMIPLIMRRQSTKGQSRLLAWNVFLISGTTTLLHPLALAPDVLTTPAYITVVVVAYLIGLVYVLMFEYYRRQERLAPDAAPATAVKDPVPAAG